MAAVPICFKMRYRNHPHLITHETNQSGRSFTRDSSKFPTVSGCVYFDFTNTYRRISVVCGRNSSTTSASGDNLSRSLYPCRNFLYYMTMMRKADQLYVCYAHDRSCDKKHIKALDSYFAKLQNDTYLIQDDAEKELAGASDEIQSRSDLSTLEISLGKLENDEDGANQDVFPGNNAFSPLDMPASEGKVAPPSFMNKNNRQGNFKKYEGQQGSQALQQFDEASDLYLISIIVSVNIAVFLFEIASPVRYSELEVFSIPLLYGAKINQLILVGEWWRLLTPMFLHSGLLHVALGCWALLTLGPKVSKSYGSLTFFLIYLLGGISGNLTSFIHTPELTVGGTGPIFAMIGAWLTYQYQNRDIVSKEATESMFQKAIIITGLSFLLSHFGPIDDWTHFGGAITGMLYGYFTCPTLQMDNASSIRSGQKEGITLVRKYADPCKSVLVFTLFMLVLGSLAFIVEPRLSALVTESFE